MSAVPCERFKALLSLDVTGWMNMKQLKLPPVRGPEGQKRRHVPHIEHRNEQMPANTSQSKCVVAVNVNLMFSCLHCESTTSGPHRNKYKAAENEVGPGSHHSVTGGLWQDGPSDDGNTVIGNLR